MLLDEATGTRHQIVVFGTAHSCGDMPEHLFHSAHFGASVVDVAEIAVGKMAANAVAPVERGKRGDTADESAAKPALVADEVVLNQSSPLLGSRFLAGLLAV